MPVLTWGLPRSILLLATASLAACGDAPAPAPAEDTTELLTPAEFAAAEQAYQQRQRGPDQKSIDAARDAIWREPKVRDFDYRPDNVVQWIVAVEDDGSPRYGYAGYICLLLREHGVDPEDQAVRVVDFAEHHQGEEYLREASLGALRCKDEGRLDDAPAVG